VAFSAAAVPSEATLEAMNTPCFQSKASVTSGTAEARRPPNRMAEIGTPAGSSHSAAITGHWPAGQAKRALGWAAGSVEAGVQSLPFQSIRWAGGVLVMPSHQTSPSSVRATLVKIASWARLAMQFGLVFSLVPGATPK